MRGPRWYAAKRGRRDPDHAAIGQALTKLGHLCIDLGSVGDGVLDWLVFPRRTCRAANALEPTFLEVKTLTGKLRKKQLEFIALLESWGIRHAVARNVAEAVEAFR